MEEEFWINWLILFLSFFIYPQRCVLLHWIILIDKWFLSSEPSIEKKLEILVYIVYVNHFYPVFTISTRYLPYFYPW